MQLIWGIRPMEYNMAINQFNLLVKENKLTQAKSLLEKINKKSIFTNSEIDRRFNLIQIKLRESYFIHSSNQEAYIQSLIYLNQNKKTACLNSLREAIKNHPSDDNLKALYEYLITENNIFADYLSENNANQKKYSQKEALAILDLMKKKEKYIKYDKEPFHQ